MKGAIMTNMSILFPIVITWIIVAAIVVVFAATRKPLSNEDTTVQDKYPQYFFISLGMTLGIVSGILLGLAVSSVPGGIAVGIGIGLIVGQLLEKRHKGSLPRLTEQEKRER